MMTAPMRVALENLSVADPGQRANALEGDRAWLSVTSSDPC